MVVLTAQHLTKSRTMGFVVDAVSDVLNTQENDIKAAPAFGGSLAQHYIEGIVNVAENVVTLLDVTALQTIEKQSDNY